MSIFKSKKLILITIVYWVLLVYIVAALVWWFIELEQQNRQMTAIELHDVSTTDANYHDKVAKIKETARRNTMQYIGEGATFLVLIFIGALFVYRATRRQFRLSLQQQNFMMAITHELKTPVAITRLNLETLQKRKLEEAQQQRLIANSLQETARLNDLCNNILLASQLEAGAYRITPKQVDLSKLLAETVENYIVRYPNREITFEIEEAVFIKGEELLLRLMMNNLVENALKYTPKDKKVDVKLTTAGGTISIVVADEGPGIEEKERKKIFEKFYRVGNETTRTAKGTGLGLYLVKRVAEDHKGKVNVSSNDGNGSIFTVTFRR